MSSTLRDFSVNDRVWLRLLAKDRLRIGPGSGPQRVVAISWSDVSDYCLQIEITRLNAVESRWIRLDEVLCKGTKIDIGQWAPADAPVYPPRIPFAPPIPAKEIFSKIGNEGS
jgi:hypothetical protein